MSEDGRHLTNSTLEKYWASGLSMVVPLQGSPPCQFRLDPAHATVELVTDYATPEPDVSRLKNVSFFTSSDDDRMRAHVSVRVDDTLYGAYGLLSTIADELQIVRAPLAAAVATAIDRHRNMFAPRAALTREKEIGLYGELLLLEFLVATIGAEPAVRAWQGPLSEEHDYVFDVMHFEVKTTSAERRKHVVHGLAQLVPRRNVPLSLISIQITRSGTSAGRTLPELVARVRSLADGYVVQLDRRLRTLNWNTEDADLYRTAWVLRSRPRAYSISGDFPVMTPALLGPVIPNYGLISDVSYVIDLTNRIPDSIPVPFNEFIEESQGDTL